MEAAQSTLKFYLTVQTLLYSSWVRMLYCAISSLFSQEMFIYRQFLFVFNRHENTNKHAKDASEDKNLSVFWFTRLSWKHICYSSSNQTEVSGGESYWWWELCCCETVCRQVSVIMRFTPVSCISHLYICAVYVPFYLSLLIIDKGLDAWKLDATCMLGQRWTGISLCCKRTEFLLWNPVNEPRPSTSWCKYRCKHFRH